ncbi:hypothetical protein [Pedobacter frigoris]|uniref:Lipoprotein n=1 Tax=Pedobacter frigoris TaxID=2571272 RepID=A0A4U1CKH5_9SPHI|nr:hypothetical protein [Pedobacter frigoris]TKC07156.1 hypothetical protein FA047_07815 [Pedobacter frigoris]
MKPSTLLIALIAFFIISCNNENRSPAVSDTTEMIAEDTTFTATIPVIKKNTECYQFVKNKDTVSMTLNIEGEELTGDLNYKWFEKDRNSCTFAGELKGDTIIAEYLFDAEGMRSVRDVVFIRKDGKLYEGFGHTTEKVGKVVFTDRSQLKFGDAVVLSKVPCN